MVRALPPTLAVLGLLSIAAGAGAATENGYTSSCGSELNPSGLGLTSGGPICGSDGGDSANYSGQPAPVTFFGETGSDSVTGSPGDDRLQGGPGNDRLDRRSRERLHRRGRRLRPGQRRRR